jgi:hypothetical protein
MFVLYAVRNACITPEHCFNVLYDVTHVCEHTAGVRATIALMEEAFVISHPFIVKPENDEVTPDAPASHQV